VPVEGVLPWDILFGGAASHLSMQLDVGHALEAGAVLAAGRAAGGTQWFIVEQEQYPYPQVECARRCLAGLHRLLD